MSAQLKFQRTEDAYEAVLVVTHRGPDKQLPPETLPIATLKLSRSDTGGDVWQEWNITLPDGTRLPGAHLTLEEAKSSVELHLIALMRKAIYLTSVYA